MPAFVRGAVSIPDHARLLRELRLLERRTSPSGKDTIDHGKNGSDDYANSLCGCIANVLKEQKDIEAMQPVGSWPAKLFDLSTGVQLNKSQPPASGPEGENAAAQIASLKAQHEEMRRAVEPHSKPVDWDALAATQKAREANQPPKLMFYGKLFGAR
jgi:hypothetical protein